MQGQWSAAPLGQLPAPHGGTADPAKTGEGGLEPPSMLQPAAPTASQQDLQQQVAAAVAAAAAAANAANEAHAATATAAAAPVDASTPSGGAQEDLQLDDGLLGGASGDAANDPMGGAAACGIVNKRSFDDIATTARAVAAKAKARASA